jgi:hypothetical protein
MTKTRDQIIEQELENINKRVKRNRAEIRMLSDVFEYDYNSGNYVRVAGKSEKFEDYLEKSAKLPTNNELINYELYYDHKPNDSLCIYHQVQKKNGYSITYIFLVGDMPRTLEKLTEGKCKIVETVEKAEERTYTRLSCNL